MILSALSISWVQRLGRLIGALWFFCVPIRRRVVLENLALALPERSVAEREKIARGVFDHMATTAFELLWNSRRPIGDLMKMVDLKGLDRAERIRSQGRGIVAVTAHLGNWDILACATAASGVPLTVVTKQLSSPKINQLWMESRMTAGISFAQSQGSILQILGALRLGEVVGVVVDQRITKAEGGQLIPFFDHEAWTTLAPAILAARTKAAIVPVFTFRGDDGVHVIEVGEEIEPRQSSKQTMKVVNGVVESHIREHPEQWLWLHRRWKP